MAANLADPVAADPVAADLAGDVLTPTAQVLSDCAIAAGPSSADLSALRATTANLTARVDRDRRR